MRPIVFAIALAIGLSGLSTVAWAQEAPATPEIIGFADGVLSWSDESANEEGFRILVEVKDENGNTTDFQYEVDANITNFALPAEATDLPCPSVGSLGYRLVAFNDAGDSPPSAQFGMECPPVDFMGPDKLPTSGTRPSPSDGVLPLWLVSAGVALCVLGFTLRLRRSL